MATSQAKNRAFPAASRLPAISAIAAILCVGTVVCSYAQDVQPNNPNGSWTATTHTSMGDATPLRSTESHTTSGNRSVDTLRMDNLDLNGRYQPVSETETETVQADPATTRKVVRTYRWDENGQRNLTQVTEEEARSSAGGETHVVRTTSNVDPYGNFQAMEREIADTTQTNPDTQETKTTFYLLDADGVLTPSWQTEEAKNRNADHMVAMTKTTLRPDASGIWQVSDVKENIVKKDDVNRTSEERIWDSDSEGRLSEVLHTIDREEETASGEKRNTVETYSTQIPGVASDGGLHLSERVTTLQKKDSGAEITQQQIEQPNPGDPTEGLQVSAKKESIAHSGSASAQQPQILEIRDVNGTFNVVSVEARKLDQIPAQ